MPDRSVLENILGSFLSTAGDLYDRAIPDCNACGGRAVPLKCVRCGEYACAAHAWVNAGSGRLICGLCVKDCTDEEDDEPEGDYEEPAASNDGFPWTVLGVRPNCTLDDIKKAYRREALKKHPDRGGSDAEFSELERARKLAEEITDER